MLGFLIAFSLLATLLVVFGVGFLIFIHELGHFLLAKKAGVRVETFSIGFGPQLFRWQRGDTVYQVAAIPLGGYVKMWGEAPGEADSSDPGALGSKSVGWRFLIFSGGVFMNTLFAFIAFPLIFYVGMPFLAPEIGGVIPGSAAWKAGLQKGDQVLSIDGQEIQSFKVLATEAALAGDNGLLLEVQSKGETKPRMVRVQPQYEVSRGLKDLGVSQAYDIDWKIKIDDGDNPARRAGLLDGDILVSLNMGGKDMEEDFELFRKSVQLHPEAWIDEEGKAARKLDIDVQRGAKRVRVELEPATRKIEDRLILGIRPLSTRVAALRYRDQTHAPAIQKLGLSAGLVLTQFEARTGQGSLWYPFYERESFGEALDKIAADGNARQVLLHFRRLGKDQDDFDSAAFAKVEVPAELLDTAGREALKDSIALEDDLVSGRVQVTPYGAAWNAGMRSGDRLLTLGGRKARSWDDVLSIVQKAKGKPLDVEWAPTVRDGSSVRPVTKKIRPQALVMPAFGFGPTIQAKTRLYQSSSFLESLSAGASNSIFQIRQLYVTLKRILGGSVSSKNIGGVISISVYTYETAKGSWQKFLYFLAILSLNLAFINVLPIPVLDGGHLLFLLIEKIKGSPVSESVMTYAQYIGVALILSLVIYVTFNDIVRHILGG